MRAPHRLVALLACLPLLAGCGPTVARLVTPDGGYAVRSGVAYGPLPRQKLDLYEPDGSRAGAPLVVFFYGGGWRDGSKDLYPFVGEALASRGIPVAIPDYRVHPQVVFPDFVEDGADAVAFAARAFGRPIILMGHSAGAQIALLLTLDERFLADRDVAVCGAVAGAIGLSGPYDFLPLDQEKYRQVFPPALREASQPINFADGPAPPLLLVTGDDDDTVEPGNTTRLAAAVEAAGGEAEVRIYPGAGHLATVGALSVPFRGRAPTLEDVLAFIDDRVKAGYPGCR